MAWWSATSIDGGKIPSEEDLTAKIKKKRMLGLQQSGDFKNYLCKSRPSTTVAQMKPECARYKTSEPNCIMYVSF